MKLWRDYADFLFSHFPGVKMQKLAVNAGFSCPNRDGTKGRGGCVYCNNSSFNPSYCDPSESVEVQIERGKAFFARKYPAMRYLAYFQAYTNTHSADIDRLMELYERACRVDRVDGVVIGTRPDCVPEALLSRLTSLPWAMVEYGAESAHDSTLSRVNRCHTWADTVDAVERTARLGLPVGLHLIMGLPGETTPMMLDTIREVNRLPVDVVKIHQLQILRHTPLHRAIESGETEVHIFTPQEYASLCADITEVIRPDIAIERFASQAPSELLVAPRWGLKNYQFTSLVEKELQKRLNHQKHIHSNH